MPALASLRSPRTALRRGIRRHRRPIAALLAAAATLIALTALRAPAPAPSTAAGGPAATISDPSQPRPGESTVPVLLSSSAVAAVLRPGDVVDLVAASPSGAPELVAAGARVVDRPDSGGGLVPSGGGLLVVAVDAEDALEVAVSSSRDDLTVVIRSPFADRSGAQ